VDTLSKWPSPARPTGRRFRTLYCERAFARWARALGERGICNAVHGVLAARPPPATSNTDRSPMNALACARDAVIDDVAWYNSKAVSAPATSASYS
jgi:hypothetical protein